MPVVAVVVSAAVVNAVAKVLVVHEAVVVNAIAVNALARADAPGTAAVVRQGRPAAKPLGATSY